MRYLLTTLGVVSMALFLGAFFMAGVMIAQGRVVVGGAAAILSFCCLYLTETIDTRLES